MDLTNEQLEELKNFGAAFYDLEVVSICMELDIELLKEAFNDKKSAAYKAYFSGFYQSELMVRKVIIKQALNGSNQAQNLITKFKDECDKQNKMIGIYGN